MARKTKQLEKDGFAFYFIRQDGQLYIGLTDEYAIHGFDTVGQALGYFERAYRANHGRGYEASMSACIHAVTFQPRVGYAPNLNWFVANVLDEARDVVQLRNVSGHFLVAKARPSAMSIYDAADVPSLI